MYRVRNETRNSVVAESVERAATLWQRTKGLLGRSHLPSGHGLWIERCNSIHTHFMRFAIDAVFVGRSGEVVRTFSSLGPFRMTPFIRNSNAVLELPAGTLAVQTVEVGDRLVMEPRA